MSGSPARLDNSNEADSQNKINEVVAAVIALSLVAIFGMWAWRLSRPNGIPWKYLPPWRPNRPRRNAVHYTEQLELQLSNTPNDTASGISPTDYRDRNSPSQVPHSLQRIDEEHGIPAHATSGSTPIGDAPNRVPADWRNLKASFSSWLESRGKSTLAQYDDKPAQSMLSPHANPAASDNPPSAPNPSTTNASNAPPAPRRKAPTISAPIISPATRAVLEARYITPPRPAPVPTRTTIQREVWVRPGDAEPTPSRARFTPTTPAFDDCSDLPDDARVLYVAQQHPPSWWAQRRASEASVFRAHPGTRMSSV